eukprot:Opistho-1_new@90729
MSSSSGQVHQPPTAPIPALFGSTNAATPVAHGRSSVVNIGSTRLNTRRNRSKTNRSLPRDGASSLDEGRLHKPVTGPIAFQTAIQFTAFIVIYQSGNFFDWAPRVRPFTIVPYAATAFVALQLSRLTLARWPASNASLYISFIPFALMCVFSREGHMLLAAVWFVTMMCTNVQSGASKMRTHVLVASAAFIGCYIACVRFMDFFYSDTTGLRFWRGRIFEANRKIDYGGEVTFMIALFILGVAFNMLERFIKKYGTTLLERENNVNELFYDNEELKKQLQKATAGDRKLDLDSPLTKVIQLLREIQRGRDATHDVVENLEFVIQILSSNELFAPNLEFPSESVDSEVHTWLHSLLHTHSSRTDLARTARVQSRDSITPIAEHSASSSVGATGQPVGLIKEVFRTEKHIRRIFEGIDMWEMDVFEIGQITNGRPLFYIAQAIFEKRNFIPHFNIDEQKLRRWLTAIEEGYKASNPYHNSMHAADVAQTIHFFLSQNALKDAMSMEEMFGAVIAALIHDFEHPGFNNAFLINTRHPLAIRYNDRSVLENHHCASAFHMMKTNESLNIFSNFSKQHFKEIRETIVNLVLATDMAHHFEYVGKFKNKLSGNGFDFAERKDRALVLEIAIKCADVSNPAKPHKMCTRWS